MAATTLAEPRPECPWGRAGAESGLSWIVHAGSRDGGRRRLPARGPGAVRQLPTTDRIRRRCGLPHPQTPARHPRIPPDARSDARGLRPTRTSWCPIPPPTGAADGPPHATTKGPVSATAVTDPEALPRNAPIAGGFRSSTAPRDFGDSDHERYSARVRTSAPPIGIAFRSPRTARFSGRTGRPVLSSTNTTGMTICVVTSNASFSSSRLHTTSERLVTFFLFR